MGQIRENDEKRLRDERKQGNENEQVRNGSEKRGKDSCKDAV